MLIHSFFLILLVLAIYLFIAKPLRKKGIPESLEVGLAVVLILSVVIYFGLSVIAPIMIAEQEENQPCGQRTFQGKCYNLSQEACLSAWTNYEEACWKEAKSGVTSPSQLLGSGVKKCAQRMFDKYMIYNRKAEEGSGCAGYFKSLQE